MKDGSRLLTLCGKVSDAGVIACGFLILAASLMIGVEVVARKLFGWSLEGADELSGYVLAITSTWALSATLLGRRHIRIDSLYNVLPARFRLALDLLSLLAMIVFFGFVLRFGWDLFMRSVNLGARAMTPLATPLAIPQGLWLAGLAVFLLVALCLLGKTLQHLLAGRGNAAMALVSSRSAEEEVAEEVRDLERRNAAAQAKLKDATELREAT
ncbi:TRAP transporter small permease subunit [Azoarcus sp. TTM-91]|uniref:TRAP transporter small permease subunit n=1 Tax=Azoarcus sp. TTM-91 TaxID=2691581 RepID=UPI00145F0A73|nr:TRAP transporter small permease subunit [Azoarcus sp. TTM-91]